jgi:hypothetical protein
MKFRVFCSHIDIDVVLMEAVRTSETSVNIYLTTRQYISEDSKLLIIVVWQLNPCLCNNGSHSWTHCLTTVIGCDVPMETMASYSLRSEPLRNFITIH